MTDFHNFDPWDMLVDLQTAQLQQQQQIATLVQAHNTQQNQVNQQHHQIQVLTRKIQQLQSLIASLSLNIVKDAKNG